MHFFDVNLQIPKPLQTSAMYPKILVRVGFSKQAETSLQTQKKTRKGEWGDPDTEEFSRCQSQARGDKENKPRPRVPRELIGGRGDSRSQDGIQSNFIWISGDKELQNNLALWGKIGSKTRDWLPIWGKFSVWSFIGWRWGWEDNLNRIPPGYSSKEPWKPLDFFARERLGRWLSWPSNSGHY